AVIFLAAFILLSRFVVDEREAAAAALRHSRLATPGWTPLWAASLWHEVQPRSISRAARRHCFAASVGEAKALRRRSPKEQAMCRWIAYRGETIPLEQYVTAPAHSLVVQSQRALESTAATNGDGFGMGWYGEHAEPGLYREVRPAWSDENLRYLCRHI